MILPNLSLPLPDRVVAGRARNGSANAAVTVNGAAVTDSISSPSLTSDRV